MIIEGWTVHPSVTLERVCARAEAQMMTLDNPGICLSCGADAEGCEPDACHYECEVCGAEAVFGAGELLIHFT